MSAFNYNNVTLGGRLTQDPELKTTPSGISVCSFTIAINRRSKGGESTADFINCVAWRQTAEFVSRYFRKGSGICVDGSVQTRSWEKDGQKRFATEVVVSEAYFVDAKNEMPQPSASQQTYIPQSYQQSPPKMEEIGDPEDLPF